MCKLSKVHLLVLSGLILCLDVFSIDAQSITGIWMTENDEAKVEIYEQDSVWFGRVIWAKDPGEQAQKGVGVVVLRNFVRQKNGSYKGNVYAPHWNRTFSAVITPKNQNELSLRGYAGISLFGSTQKWERIKNIEKNLER